MEIGLHYREWPVTRVAEVNADPRVSERWFFLGIYLFNNAAQPKTREVTADNRKTKDISNANRLEIFTFVFNGLSRFPTLRRSVKFVAVMYEHAARRLRKIINNAELDAGKIKNAYAALRLLH